MEANTQVIGLNSVKRKPEKVGKQKSRKQTQRMAEAEADSDPQNDEEVTDSTFHQRLLDKLQSLDSNSAKK